MLFIQLAPGHSINVVVHKALTWLTANLWWEPGDTGVVIGYQDDGFNLTWLVECFIAQIHSYSGFTGKVPTLPYFPFEPGCEYYSSLDQVDEDLEDGLHSVLTNSINTPELDASFDKADAMPSSVC